MRFLGADIGFRSSWYPQHQVQRLSYKKCSANRCWTGLSSHWLYQTLRNTSAPRRGFRQFSYRNETTTVKAFPDISTLSLSVFQVSFGSCLLRSNHAVKRKLNGDQGYLEYGVFRNNGQLWLQTWFLGAGKRCCVILLQEWTCVRTDSRVQSLPLCMKESCKKR